MNTNRTICIFTGAGFSKALFKEPIQNEFIEEFMKLPAPKRYLRDCEDDFSKNSDIEYWMSEYDKLAGQHVLGYDVKIISIRSVLANYYYERALSYSCNKSSMQLIGDFLEKLGKDKIFFVTTNFDLSIETVLNDKFGDDSYYYPDSAKRFFVNQSISPKDLIGKIPIFKLHGSANWIEERAHYPERDTGKIEYFELQIYTAKNILDKMKLGEFPKSYRTGDKRYVVWLMIDNIKYSSILIPYMKNKARWICGPHFKPLFEEHVWPSAKDHMQYANYFYFFGYSLPEADEYIKKEFLTGVLQSRSKSNHEIVDPKDETNLISLFKELGIKYKKEEKEELIDYLNRAKSHI